MSEQINLSEVGEGKLLEALGVGEHEDDISEDALKKLTPEQLKEVSADVEMEEDE